MVKDGENVSKVEKFRPNFSRCANCDIAPLKTKRHKECLLQREAYGKGVLNRIITYYFYTNTDMQKREPKIKFMTTF